MPARVEMRGIVKRYGRVAALRGVDLDVRADEVLALVGQNGAGKSTLVRVLTGAERPDAGTLRLDGALLAPADPRAGARAGIAMLHQELAGVPDLSVAENVLLGRLPRGPLGVDRRALRARARAALARVGVDLDPGAPFGDLPAALRQLVLLARALDDRARVLVLDEPTAALDAREAARLHGLVRELRAGGLAIVFIGHRLSEVVELADRVAVLRSGELVRTFARGEAGTEVLVTAMLGAPARRAEPRPPPTERGEARLSARGAACAGILAPFDLDVARGEVLGVCGLLGSGRSALLALLGGALRRTAGEVRARGRLLRAGSVRDALAAGVARSPEERRSEGLFLPLSVRENVALGAARSFGLRSRVAEVALARSYVDRLAIACADLEQPVGELSGGNQQKVLLARALAAAPDVLLLDEPTRGIDPGAKQEVLSLVGDLARQGLGVALVSSELEEVLGSSDRVLVLREGRLARELVGGALSADAALAAMAGEAG